MNARHEGRKFGLASTLYRGSALFLAVYVAGSGISFGVHLLMARVLGATSYGYFIYATSWMAILLLGCNVGLKPTVIRFVAAYGARREWGLLRGLVRAATAWTVAASLAIVTLSATAMWVLRPQLDELGVTLLFVAAAMPFMALGEVWCSAVRGLGAVARSQIPASIVQHLLVAMAFTIIVVASGMHEGAISAAQAFLLATVGALAVAGWLLHKMIPPQVRGSDPRYLRGEWAHVAGNNVLIAFFQAVRAPMIVVIAGAYVDSQHLAYYGVAQRLANVVSLGLLGISGFATPLISRYFALADFARMQRLAHLAARGALGGALVVALILLAFGHAVLRLFGDGFENAYVSLLVLLAGELVAAASGPVGFFLTMTGRQMTATLIEGVASAIAIGLALVLIPRHGILGAAIVVAVGSVVRNAAMFVAVWRHFGLRSAVI